jgi:hypothetical protein
MRLVDTRTERVLAGHGGIGPIATKDDVDAVVRAIERGGDGGDWFTEEEFRLLIDNYEKAVILVKLFDLLRSDRLALRWSQDDGDWRWYLAEAMGEEAAS